MARGLNPFQRLECASGALEQARATAGAEIVTVMGGASIGQQYIAGGLVDEIRIHLVPVLFGSGTRMFEHLRDQHIRLEPIEVIEAATATHICGSASRADDGHEPTGPPSPLLRHLTTL